MATATKSDLKKQRHKKSRLNEKQNIPSQNGKVYSALDAKLSRRLNNQRRTKVVPGPMFVHLIR